MSNNIKFVSENRSKFLTTKEYHGYGQILKISDDGIEKHIVVNYSAPKGSGVVDWERVIKADKAIATGDNQTPYWPKTSISENQNKDYTEYYSVTVQEENSHGKNIQRRYRMTNLSDWKSLKKGEKVTLMVDRFNFATLT